MTLRNYRRPYKWWEHLLLSTPTSLVFGIIFCIIIPYGIQLAYQVSQGYEPTYYSDRLINTFFLCSICYLIVFSLHTKIAHSFPGTHSVLILLPQLILVYILGFSFAAVVRIPISNSYTVSAFLFCTFWMTLEHHVKTRFAIPKLAVLDLPITQGLKDVEHIQCVFFSAYQLPQNQHFDAVVVDLNQLDNKGERFVAKLIIQGTAVYGIDEILEVLTGRVRVHHVAHDNMGTWLPSAGYLIFKDILDRFLVLLLSPIVLIILLFCAIAIKLEDGGPVFYSQIRIGKGGKAFYVHKLRTMTHQHREMVEGNRRDENIHILRVGHLLRKMRLDELPQFWNVLRGDMSLIGPRPEMLSLVKKYRREVPFYMYRHMVKPGISGWAQVRHGYAYDANDTLVKIEFDFYYIKNCSLALDFYIFLLTILTVITGFGAR